MKKSIWFTFAMVVAGLFILFIPEIWLGFTGSALHDRLVALFEAIGTTVFLAGTVSLGVEELIRRRTEKEFEEKLRNMLEIADNKQRSQLIDFLKGYVSDLAVLLEQLSSETSGARIRMIYSSREKGLKAMAEAIREAGEFVYIMGISLRQFFGREDTECGRAVSDAYGRESRPKFRVLILDNKSEEALERSSREEGVNYTGIDDPVYKENTLYRETSYSIAAIQKHYQGMEFRVYSPPSLFLLITEKTVLMEPYHLGDRKIVDPSAPPHLYRVAELVPLVEFDKASERGPYEQFLGHFKYVFDNSESPHESEAPQC